MPRRPRAYLDNNPTPAPFSGNRFPGVNALAILYSRTSHAAGPKMLRNRGISGRPSCSMLDRQSSKRGWENVSEKNLESGRSVRAGALCPFRPSDAFGRRRI